MLSPKELEKIAAVGAMFNAARNIVDFYRCDMFEANNRDERIAVWRMYRFALLSERALRTIGGPKVRFRKAASDKDMSLPFRPYWAKLSDDMLNDLEDAMADRPR